MAATRSASPGRNGGSLGITDEEFDNDRAGVLARLRAQGDLDFGPAVLDPAHIGDIQGAPGTISLRDRAPRRTWWRLITFAAILGPGIIVMTGDNDAGGVQTYTQAGQQYGNSMMWCWQACSWCCSSRRRWSPDQDDDRRRDTTCCASAIVGGMTLSSSGYPGGT